MQSTIPNPSFADITSGSFVDVIISFLRDLPNKLGTLGESGSYLNFLYFLWALTVVLAGLLIYLAICIHYLERKEKEGYYRNHSDSSDLNVGKKTNKHTKAWNEIVNALKSDNISDWKIAVLEADSLLAELFEGLGYPGDNLGERLKAVPNGAIETLEDAWSAHKLRNRIAHEGASFIMTKVEFVDAIARFERVFSEFNYR